MPLTYGTDAGVYPHGLNARQFGYMVRYGMTPMQALASATSEAAKALGRDDLGSVTPGHVADLVAVGRDPLEDITVLQCIDGVVQGGRLVHRDDAADALRPLEAEAMSQPSTSDRGGPRPASANDRS